MTGLEAAIEADSPRASSPPIRRAATVVAVGSGLGPAGQLLFHDVGPGINVPVAMALLLIAGWPLRSRSERPAPERMAGVERRTRTARSALQATEARGQLITRP